MEMKRKKLSSFYGALSEESAVKSNRTGLKINNQGSFFYHCNEIMEWHNT